MIQAQRFIKINIFRKQSIFFLMVLNQCVKKLFIDDFPLEVLVLIVNTFLLCFANIDDSRQIMPCPLISYDYDYYDYDDNDENSESLIPAFIYINNGNINVVDPACIKSIARVKPFPIKKYHSFNQSLKHKYKTVCGYEFSLDHVKYRFIVTEIDNICSAYEHSTVQVSNRMVNDIICMDSISEFCMIVTKNEIYGLGAYGSMGHIGKIEKIDGIPDMYKFKLGDKIDSNNILQVKCGFYYTNFLTKDGYIYCNGYNNRCQLGIDSNGRAICSFQKITLSKKVVLISIGRNFSLAINEDLELLFTGEYIMNYHESNDNERSMLSKCMKRTKYTVIFKDVIDVQSSYNIPYISCITRNGKVYTFNGETFNMLNILPRINVKYCIHLDARNLVYDDGEHLYLYSTLYDETDKIIQ